jgi:5-(carboxyamino)imidazole ribonucleotide mutase
MSRSENIRVGIILGSDSDLPTMRHAARALRALGLEHAADYEERVISAHRTPDLMRDYAESAEDRGLEVIIAGAGGSAHLQGMTASETIIPVLGVAITKNPDVMNRALGSCIGMPEGKPLAVFQGETGAFNAGLFAGRLMARRDPEIRLRYLEYNEELRVASLDKDEELHRLGSEEYLRQQAEPKEA